MSFWNRIASLIAPRAVPAASGPLSDMPAFFAALKPALFRSITQSQVDGLNALVRASTEAGWPRAFAAYGLATAYHETAKTMQPIKEHGGAAYFHRMYDPEGSRPHVARRLGNTQPGDGVRFAGRGYVQLTGRDNYAKAGAKLRADLIANPDLAMRPDYAARIMVAGMSEGWFTGKRLSQYLPDGGNAMFEQFRMARRIINGTDKDVQIALHAVHFQNALEKGGMR